MNVSRVREALLKNRGKEFKMSVIELSAYDYMAKSYMYIGVCTSVVKGVKLCIKHAIKHPDGLNNTNRYKIDFKNEGTEYVLDVTRNLYKNDENKLCIVCPLFGPGSHAFIMTNDILEDEYVDDFVDYLFYERLCDANKNYITECKFSKFKHELRGFINDYNWE